MKQVQTEFTAKVKSHFKNIYGEQEVEDCMERFRALKKKYDLSPQPSIPQEDLWTQQDQVLITYADMIKCPVEEGVSHLGIQHRFLKERLSDQISTVHLLPFFPSSSDDGFSVIDYRQVDEEYGSWKNIEAMAQDFRIMADLVINHVSRYSDWFRKYLRREEPFTNYFIEVERGTDLSKVTRPRSTPLVTAVQTEEGKKLVWTTFSNDQKDVNFSNPEVLFEYLDIIFFYLSEGIRVIRLDAVAYIWKEIGTSCIHLPQTHEIVKLFRTLVDQFAPDVTLITETNVPHKENISYFGDGDETHMVYQFSLPPLLLHALVSENGSYLTSWASSLKPLPHGCTYFNFTASHDGIGMRPLEGLIPDDEFMQVVEGVKSRGGFVSYKQNANRSMSPYELNITYFDAFATLNGRVRMQARRYLCSQIIMLSLQGVPGIYFHNLTGTRNNLQGVMNTGRQRLINRKKWDYDELTGELDREGSVTGKIFNRYKEILDERNRHPAFHPMGGQTVYDAGSEFFILERRSPDESETVLLICNMTMKMQELDLAAEGVPVDRAKTYRNLLSGRRAVVDGKSVLDPYDAVWIKL